jgi:exodeoxyribonuclease VII small subunit
MATDGGKQRPAESGAEGKPPPKGAKSTPDAAPADKAADRTADKPKAKPPATNRPASPASPASSTGPGTGPGPGDTPRLPYEQARDQLTELVKRLEAGGLTLEQSLELWERGERLAAICEEWLEGARARLAAAMSQRTDHEPAPGTPF